MKRIDIEEIRNIEDVPVGAFVKFRGERVYIRQEYDRAEKKYILQAFDDINRYVYKKKGTKVLVGFDF